MIFLSKSTHLSITKENFIHYPKLNLLFVIQAGCYSWLPAKEDIQPPSGKHWLLYDLYQNFNTLFFLQWAVSDLSIKLSIVFK